MHVSFRNDAKKFAGNKKTMSKSVQQRAEEIKKGKGKGSSEWDDSLNQFNPLYNVIGD